jgi:hypothetical protein
MAYQAARVMVHPGYLGYSNSKEHRNDLALIFLQKCVALGPDVGTIALATQQGERAGRPAAA